MSTIEKRDVPLEFKDPTLSTYKKKTSVYTSGYVVIMSDKCAKFLDNSKLYDDTLYKQIKERIPYISNTTFNFVIKKRPETVYYNKEGHFINPKQCIDQKCKIYIYISKNRIGKFRIIVDKVILEAS